MAELMNAVACRANTMPASVNIMVSPLASVLRKSCIAITVVGWFRGANHGSHLLDPPPIRPRK